MGEKLGERLGENQKRILQLMKADPHITIPKLAEKIGISTTSVENNITKLKKKGLLRRVGPAKGGHWEIIE
ncbi:MAG: winged helix-turn-helix domain-containing protein [Methanomassiliicoccales archaeon]|nr:MAG: winged helix-turn-helix domain-containing protein [Methanomassiliicoccales archaeon]